MILTTAIIVVIKYGDIGIFIYENGLLINHSNYYYCNVFDIFDNIRYWNNCCWKLDEKR